MIINWQITKNCPTSSATCANLYIMIIFLLNMEKIQIKVREKRYITLFSTKSFSCNSAGNARESTQVARCSLLFKHAQTLDHWPLRLWWCTDNTTWREMNFRFSPLSALTQSQHKGCMGKVETKECYEKSNASIDSSNIMQ